VLSSEPQQCGTSSCEALTSDGTRCICSASQSAMHCVQSPRRALIEAQPSAAAGLKSLASLQSTRQLDERTAASLALTWQPGLGAGLQLHSTRQLTERVNGARRRALLGASALPGHPCVPLAPS